MLSAALSAATPPPWEAELQLEFVSRAGRSLLAKRAHRGPLVVQKPLYPEGDKVCHAIVLHPPGGVAGGDQLQLRTQVAAGAHALLTTPGAGKWYKANGAQAAQRIAFSLEERAVLEWLPQETIVYDAAQVIWQTQVDLAASACYAGWEITCLGRQASGERFAAGALRQQLRICRAGRLLWNEQGRIAGSDRLLDSPAGLRGCPVFATFVVAAGAVPAAVLEACRSVVPEDGAHAGVTALPELFVGRYLGHHAQAARQYFEALWALLRPWYAGMAARRPRIWNT